MFCIVCDVKVVVAYSTSLEVTEFQARLPLKSTTLTEGRRCHGAIIHPSP